MTILKVICERVTTENVINPRTSYLRDLILFNGGINKKGCKFLQPFFNKNVFKN